MEGCDVLLGAGKVCWTGHPLAGVWLMTAALELPSDETGVDEVPPISREKQWQVENTTSSIAELVCAEKEQSDRLPERFEFSYRDR